MDLGPRQIDQTPLYQLNYQSKKNLRAFQKVDLYSRVIREKFVKVRNSGPREKEPGFVRSPGIEPGTH